MWGLGYSELSVQSFIVSDVLTKLHRTCYRYCSVQLFLTAYIYVCVCVCVCMRMLFCVISPNMIPRRRLGSKCQLLLCVLSVKETDNVGFKHKTSFDTIECQPTLHAESSAAVTSRLHVHSCLVLAQSALPAWLSCRHSYFKTLHPRRSTTGLALMSALVFQNITSQEEPLPGTKIWFGIGEESLFPSLAGKLFFVLHSEIHCKRVHYKWGALHVVLSQTE